MTAERPLTLDVAAAGSVSALLLAPAQPHACYVYAHGAGAGMSHAFMQRTARAFAERGIATLRFQFPYMERQARRTDPPAVCHATVRAACAAAARLYPDLTLLAGGRSFGGRMASQAQAIEPLPRVRGLMFFGFPLHPDGRPSIARAAHLHDVLVPLLFLQGDRDKLASLNLLAPLVASLGSQATLQLVPGADHALNVLKSSGRTETQVLVELTDAATQWIGNL